MDDWVRGRSSKEKEKYGRCGYATLVSLTQRLERLRRAVIGTARTCCFLFTVLLISIRIIVSVLSPFRQRTYSINGEVADATSKTHSGARNFDRL